MGFFELELIYMNFFDVGLRGFVRPFVLHPGRWNFRLVIEKNLELRQYDL